MLFAALEREPEGLIPECLRYLERKLDQLRRDRKQDNRLITCLYSIHLAWKPIVDKNARQLLFDLPSVHGIVMKECREWVNQQENTETKDTEWNRLPELAHLFISVYACVVQLV